MFTEPKRRLAAIVNADVAGYSRLMGQDEADTLAQLNASRAVFRRHIGEHDGRIVDTAGDSVLAVFDSVVEALDACVLIQAELAELNAAREPARRMLFRIGINLGDVLEQSDGTVYGDGVNIAARVERLADPGGITLSGPAHDFVADRPGARWRFLGEQSVKNIVRPVRVYAREAAEIVERDDTETPAASPSATGPDAAAARLPARPSIAVLPFTNLGGSDEDEYFADGITEDIITELSRFKDMIVTSRNSTFSFKGRAVQAQEIGRALNVRYILEGSVRKAGERVRVNAQLIEADSGHHLWAERFDRKLCDVFAVQDELTRRIVATLVGRVTDSERRRARSDAGGDNPAAYDLVLRGRELWLKFNREDNLAARGLYLQAIKLDPEYPRAYAGIAWTYATAYNEYWTDDPQGSLDQALEYAQRAVYMEPASHTYRLALGMVHFFRKNVDKAIECFEKAIELNVNDADCYTMLAHALSLNGEPDKAVALLDHAFEINPYLDAWSRSLYVVAYFIAERYDDALAVMRQFDGPRMSPQMSNYRWFAATLAALGRAQEARPYVERYMAHYPTFDLDEHVARMPFRRTADRERYRDALRAAGFAGVALTA
ncbi:MAG: adenylate/guanylate cyclase domain-containing protein [Gammaproteobacteria bacterium]